MPPNQHEIEVKAKVKGKSVIEQSLKKTKARLNAAYVILFKEEIQYIYGAEILVLRLKQMRAEWRIHFIGMNLQCCATDN